MFEPRTRMGKEVLKEELLGIIFINIFIKVEIKLKKFKTLISALQKIHAKKLIKKIQAYETLVQYPRMWSPNPTHTPNPKKNARDSEKSYSYPGHPLNIQYLSEDFLNKLGFIKPELSENFACPSCRLKFAKKFAYCPNCGQEYPSSPADSLRSVQEQDAF